MRKQGSCDEQRCPVPPSALCLGKLSAREQTDARCPRSSVVMSREMQVVRDSESVKKNNKSISLHRLGAIKEAYLTQKLASSTGEAAFLPAFCPFQLISGFHEGQHVLIMSARPEKQHSLNFSCYLGKTLASIPDHSQICHPVGEPSTG